MALPPRRVVLFLLLSAALLSIPLTWESLQSLRFPTIARLTPLSPPPPPLTNNNVTYPRRPPHILSPDKAQEYIDRLNAIRHIAFTPHSPFIQELNFENVDRLLQYLARAEAGEPLPPPRVILSSWHFQVTCYQEGSTMGEVIWMRPLLKLMQEQDIFIIHAPFQDKTFHKDFKLIGDDLITHTWMDDENLIWCFQDPEYCIQSPQNPDGVPLWKMFAFTFWGSLPSSGKWQSAGDISWSFNPLGREWNLVPYQMPEGHFFIGYHFEGCQALEYVPLESRPDQIVILAKRSDYFHDRPRFFDPTFYSRLKNITNYEIISNARLEDGFPIPDGLTNVGLLPIAEYDLQLANTKVLLGIGKPQISPTPYASLCRGVPVVLPYRSDSGCPARPDPSDYCGFYEHNHQHGPAARIGEPYIYTVDVTGPVEDIIETIERAANTPIEPFEPEEMRIDSVRQRLLDYFEIDWETYAKTKGLGTKEMELPPWLIDWGRRFPDPSLN